MYKLEYIGLSCITSLVNDILLAHGAFINVERLYI